MKIKSLFESIFDDVVILEEGINYMEMLTVNNPDDEFLDFIGNAITMTNSNRDQILEWVSDEALQKYLTELRNATTNSPATDSNDFRVWLIRFLKYQTLLSLEELTRNFANLNSLDNDYLGNLQASVERSMEGFVVNEADIESFDRRLEVSYRDTDKLLGKIYYEQERLKDVLDPDGFLQYITWKGVYNSLMYADFLNKYHALPERFKTFRFSNQTVSQVFDEIKEIQADYNEYLLSLKRSKMIEYSNGLAWYNLGTCQDIKEGRLMGHCGASMLPSATLISLRKYRSGGAFEPFVTATLEKKGTISDIVGQSKGEEGMRPPDEEFHSYIVDLLLHSDIKVLKDPTSGFQIEHLSDENLNILLDRKPELVPMKIRVERLGATSLTDEEIQRLSPLQFYNAVGDIPELQNRLQLIPNNPSMSAEWYDRGRLMLKYRPDPGFSPAIVAKSMRDKLFYNIRNLMENYAISTMMKGGQNIFQEFIEHSNLPPRSKEIFNQFFFRIINDNSIAVEMNPYLKDIKATLIYILVDYWIRVTTGILNDEFYDDASHEFLLEWHVLNIQDITENNSITYPDLLYDDNPNQNNSVFTLFENNEFKTIITLNEFLENLPGEDWEYEFGLITIKVVSNFHVNGSLNVIIDAIGNIPEIQNRGSIDIITSPITESSIALIDPRIADPNHRHSEMFDYVRNRFNEAFSILEQQITERFFT